MITVLLADGTVGQIEVMDVIDFNKIVIVELADENGTPIKVSGVIVDVLED